jgi:endonuclease G, mitochondrial
MASAARSDPTAEAFGALRRAVEDSSGGDVCIAREHAAILLEYEPEPARVDRDYSDRGGYDRAFLEGFDVPLPALTDAHLADAPVPPGAADPVLRYHHFSVIMSGSRRLARVTAANVDGRRHFDLDRASDRWIFDDRVPDTQVGNSVYDGNPFDRGHLVRRLDPSWGDRIDIALAAVNDTFHFTNCAPQHERFNRNPRTWHGVEDFILSHADCDNLRLSVFTGPVLDPDDPPHAAFPEFRIPRRFWKVVAVLPESRDSLSALAFVLSQAELIETVVAAPADAKDFQVSVAEVERLTELDFGDLREFDARVTEPTIAAADEWQELHSVADIVIPGA